MGEFFKWLAELIKGAKCWITVLPWELAVRVRAGKHTAQLGPGLHFRIPYLDDVRVVNTRLRVAPVPSHTLSTKDGKAVTVAGAVGFCINDPLAASTRFHYAESTCAVLAQKHMARYIVARTVAELNVPELEAEVVSVLTKECKGAGLAFEFMSVTDFAIVRTIRLMQESWRQHTGEERL